MIDLSVCKHMKSGSICLVKLNNVSVSSVVSSMEAAVRTVYFAPLNITLPTPQHLHQLCTLLHVCVVRVIGLDMRLRNMFVDHIFPIGTVWKTIRRLRNQSSTQCGHRVMEKNSEYLGLHSLSMETNLNNCVPSILTYCGPFQGLSGIHRISRNS